MLGDGILVGERKKAVNQLHRHDEHDGDQAAEKAELDRNEGTDRYIKNCLLLQQIDRPDRNLLRCGSVGHADRTEEQPEDA